MKKEGSDRINYGIELLRIVSMFMVVVLHVLNKGGVITGTKVLSTNYEIGWLLEAVTICAVNCFAIISGYVGITAKYKYSRMLYMWLRVIFYTISITLVFQIFAPNTVGVTEWLSAIFPVMFVEYWYVTAYFGVLVFMPILNIAGNKLSKTQYGMVILSMIFFFSVMQTIFRHDTYKLGFGYTTWWLIILYLIGGYVRKHGGVLKTFKKKTLLLLYMVVVLTMWGLKFMIEFLTTYWANTIKGEFLFDYTSPLVLTTAFLLFLLFERIDLKAPIMKKVVSFAAPLSFSVYLIHTQKLVWEYVIYERFLKYGQYHPMTMIVMVFVTSVIIYLLCIAIDVVRERLFKLLKIKQFLDHLEKKYLHDIWS